MHNNSKITRQWPHAIASTILLVLLAAVPASARDAVGNYTVLLKQPAVNQILSAATQKGAPRIRLAQPQLQELTRQAQAAQEPVKTAIRTLGVEVTGSVCHTLNAIFIRATKEQAEQLKLLPGIKRVDRARRFRLLADAAGEIVGAPAAWNTMGGIENAGAGIRIGILDTGIDIDHPAFADPSLQAPPGFPKGRPEDLAFTNNKVIVARAYVGLLNPLAIDSSRPDDLTPRDRVGHGTAVATIAAGRRVTAPAAILTGIAPKAFLGNYKIFGSPDINEFSNGNAVIAAIDDAVTDGMDIISISFGAIAQFPFDEQGGACSDDPDAFCDPVALAAQNAMELDGVVVVAAAGNAGAFGEQQFPTLNTISTPASAPAVIAVGATVNSREFVRRVRFAGQSTTAISGTGPKPAAPLTAEALDTATLGDSFGCAPFPSDSLRGKTAVLARGDCGFELKVENATAAGAIAAVVTNVDGQDEPFVMEGLETTVIPAFIIGAAAGNDLRRAVQLSPRTTVTLDPALTPRPFAPDRVAPFSSRGPTPGGGIKPDLVAPGTFIYTGAQNFDRNGDTFDETRFVSVDGTSFAAPFVAGAAALVMQRHPEFTPAQVKSALVNGTTPEVFEADAEGDAFIARTTSIGAGLLNIPAALDPASTAEPAMISFGEVGAAQLPLERLLAITNPGVTTGTYEITVIPYDEDTAARVLIEGEASISSDLRGGEAATLLITLEGSRPSPGAYEGEIRIQRLSGGAGIRVPYYYVVGDGLPANSFAIAGTGVIGTVSEPNPEFLIFRVIDQFGQPIPNLPVQFNVVAGAGAIILSDPTTDPFGVAAADTDMGPEVGAQDFEATAGGLTIPFFNGARLKPAIGGIVNAAGFAAGRPVAPGSLISIFGANLAEFLGSASSLPLPIALKHTSVSFDFPEEGISVPSPLIFASGGQLNVQTPWEFAGLNFAFVKVRIEDSASFTFELPLADHAPGIFEFDLGDTRYGVVTHADGNVVTTQNPARPGETVVIYGTGFGPVDAPQATGLAAPSNKLTRTRRLPQVTVAGQQATVSFSGLTPGFVGLYQINAKLPATLPSGTQQLIVSANGIESNSAATAIQ